MYKISDFKVGDTVYLQLTGNAIRGKKRNTEECIKEVTVEDVKRKYVTAYGMKFKVPDNDHYKGLIEHTQYCVDYILYKTKQEILDEFEADRLQSNIKSFFGYGNISCLTLCDLRQIAQIILNAKERELGNERSE